MAGFMAQDDAFSTFYPRQDLLDVGMSSTGYLEMQMIVTQGGRCAEMLLFGREELTDGCHEDLAFISTVCCRCLSAILSLCLLSFLWGPQCQLACARWRASWRSG